MENNVFIIGEYFKVKKSDSNVLNHIEAIKSIQNILMGYHSVEKNSILSEIGKRVDRIFVMTKKLETLFKEKNYYEKRILEETKKALEELEKINYIDIYKRGMERYEICIDKIDESNLRIIDNIEIGKIKKFNFNIIEEDFINYLFKLKKRCSKEVIKEYSIEYVSKLKLRKTSLDYINLIINIPQESLKYWYKNRYEWGVFRSNLKNIAEKELGF